ncbi:MAG TPA: SIR2 family protein [Nitrososphaeraceae archaeon]
MFLGSGASAPFGLPTMIDLVRLFEEELLKPSNESTNDDDKAAEKLYHSIKVSVTNAYGYADLESIFSVLKTISEDAKYSDLGFASTYAVSKIRIDPTDTIYTSNDDIYAKKLLRKYRAFVRRKCQIKNSKDSQITCIYSDLIDKLGTKYKFQKVKGKDGKEYLYPCYCSIYTTNYDKVIETYWQGIATINDLWRTDANNISVLNTEKQDGSVLNLIKLHGSLDWFGLDNGEIIKLDSMTSTYGKRKVKGEFMLYPIQQKDLYLHPWFNLFSRFRQDLQDTKTWLVIGYNFNDEFIRNVFIEALKRKEEEHELILVTPCAAEVFESRFRKYKSKVRIVPKKSEMCQLLHKFVNK